MFNYCPDCGTKNEGWNFCPTCGRALSQAAPKTSKKATDNKELDSILSMIKKFEAELEDAENDEATLLSMPASEHSNPNYKKAWKANQDRKADILLTLKMLNDRKNAL